MRVPPDQSGTAAARRSRVKRTLPGASARVRCTSSVLNANTSARGAARRRESAKVSRNRLWVSIDPLVSRRKTIRGSSIARARRARVTSSPEVRRARR